MSLRDRLAEEYAKGFMLKESIQGNTEEVNELIREAMLSHFRFAWNACEEQVAKPLMRALEKIKESPHDKQCSQSMVGTAVDCDCHKAMAHRAVRRAQEVLKEIPQ